MIEILEVFLDGERFIRSLIKTAKHRKRRKEVFLGGLITGAAVENNKIFLGFNSGTLIVLSKKGELISKISIRELLKDFALIQSNGGVRSILWIDDGLVFVYYTAKKPDEDAFTIRAALINTQDLKLIDDIELGKFMKIFLTVITYLLLSSLEFTKSIRWISPSIPNSLLITL